MNTNITITGNVTRDPELRFTASGIATASFTVAVNRRINTRNDSAPTEVVSFFTVVAWNTLAENACISLTKGSRVVVSGRLEQRSWQTPAGEKRTVYELVAEEIGASLRFASAAIERNQRQGISIDDVRLIVHGSSAGGTSSLDPALGEDFDPTQSMFVDSSVNEPGLGETSEEVDDRELVGAAS